MNWKRFYKEIVKKEDLIGMMTPGHPLGPKEKMKLTFIAYAGPDYASRMNVWSESVIKHHPDASIIKTYLKNPTFINGYVKDFHKQKYDDIRQMLKLGKDNIVFMGADTEVFSRMVELEEALEKYDAVIIPHVPTPIKDRNYMVQLYSTGHANSDMIAFRNTPNGNKIVDWLCRVVDDELPYNGIFYDQTWVSSLPFLFDNVCILRHPGYNVGYWRDTIELSTVRFFHYSGYVKGNPSQISKHSNKVATGNILTLLEEYDRRI